MGNDLCITPSPGCPHEYICAPERVENIDIAGYITFGVTVVPFIVISFVMYKQVLLKMILSTKDYANPDILKEFNGPITKVKLVLRGVAFSSIITTMVVSTYTRYYGLPECQHSTTNIPMLLLAAVWLIALPCYIYIWHWGIKKQYQRLSKGKIGSLWDKFKTIVISQLLGLCVATAFIQDVHIGNNYGFDGLLATDDMNCVCSQRGNWIFAIQIIWICQPVLFLFNYFCKGEYNDNNFGGDKFCNLFYVFMYLSVFVQLLYRFIIFLNIADDSMSEIIEDYVYRIDWGDFLYIWLLCSMLIILIATIYVFMSSRNNVSEPNKTGKMSPNDPETPQSPPPETEPQLDQENNTKYQSDMAMAVRLSIQQQPKKEVHKAAKWKCTSCKFENNGVALKCAMCQRYIDEDIEESESKEEEAININPEQQKLKLWLTEKVQLPEYYDLLIENGIENIWTMLLVTTETLNSIGVNKVGHQLIILDQIKALNAQNKSHRVSYSDDSTQSDNDDSIISDKLEELNVDHIVDFIECLIEINPNITNKMVRVSLVEKYKVDLKTIKHDERVKNAIGIVRAKDMTYDTS